MRRRWCEQLDSNRYNCVHTGLVIVNDNSQQAATQGVCKLV